MTDKERKASIAESASNYMRGRAMALSFKPLALGDVKDAYMCGAEEMERLIDSSMWWKSADGGELPAIDREVIALTTEGKVVFAHRPKESWQGKNIDTGEVTTYYPERYGAGQWNIPDIKWWLDIEIPPTWRVIPPFPSKTLNPIIFQPQNIRQRAKEKNHGT